jgi:hypothetical protein
VEKGDSLSLRTYAWRVIDQLDSPRSATGERVVQIGDGEADVMDAWAATVDEPRDRRIGCAGLEQFDERVSGGEAGDVSSVGIFERMLIETQEISIEGKQLVDRAHGNSNVRDARSTTSGEWHENRAPYLV